ncbi:RhoGEF domain containing protein [Acanthamoeba castellanii str. Neff]|uniref:RhoGEF domain containing protein n=1 Tax=Acanthamoeba castellanii (strain ATCC 30010 / Neff) TaxID=1257118 RepID=L8GQC0_ACACF|nr:RhoGEF domain containing protein [Acanthamoeba castellanii str. Neff]ELR14853.1 RhoGEF domain containing protein [Acanthamoeba castellanii str. Neff]
MASTGDWKKVTEEQVDQWQRKQHGVKRWIEEILGMELESEDLAGPLQTGVVLCHVIRRLDERAIPRIQEDTKQLFKLKENVEFFLAACKDMGVPAFKLFKGPELWEGTGMVLVIESLVALAAMVEQQYEGAPPLVIDDQWKPPKLTDKQLIEVKKQLVRIKDKPVSGARPKVSPQIVLKKLALMAGNGVDINTYVPAFIRFQSLVRGYLQKQRYRAMVRNVAYRSRVAHEILDTESFYVKSMNQCITVWLNPLNDAIASGSPLINAADVRAIFSDIALLYTFNSELYSEIESRVAKWGTYECLGDIFLRLVDYLKVYTAYVQNFNTSMAVIERVQKKKEVAAYFQKCKEHPEGKSLDLASFLIMPVQRIPRYNLLLTDMMRHTWEDHPDYNNLKKATDKIQSIAAFINERKREAENVSKTLEISNKITGNDKLNLTEPGRRYVREGVFNEGTKDEVVAYLFTDIVVLGRPSKKLKVLGRHSVKFQDSFKLQIVELKEGPAGSNVIEFVQLGKNKVLARLEAKSKKEVDDWVKDFKKSKAELTNQTATKESLIDKGEKPKISAEERLKRRTRATKTGAELNFEDEENEVVTQLKRKREALLAQLNEFKEADGGDKRSKRRTKAQRKDTVKLFEQLQGELDEVEAALAQHQTLAPAKLKRKEAAPEKSLSATQDLMKSSPQPARSKTCAGSDSRSATPTKAEPAAGVAPQEQYGSNGATPVPGIVVTNTDTTNCDNAASTSTTTTSTTSPPTSPRQQALSHSSEKEIKQRKREEKKAEKLKKKEEKKRKKEEKKAEKQRLREEKKLSSSSSGGGRARRGTIATGSPSRDGIEISITRTAVGSATNGTAGVSQSGSTPTKLRADDDELESGAKSPRKPGSSSEKGASAEAEAKGRHDKGASAEVASKKAADAKSAPSGGDDDGGGEFYSYEELKKMKDKLDRTKLETWLAPGEFRTVFGMSKEEFAKMPAWKQKQKKDEKDLL